MMTPSPAYSRVLPSQVFDARAVQAAAMQMGDELVADTCLRVRYAYLRRSKAAAFDLEVVQDFADGLRDVEA